MTTRHEIYPSDELATKVEQYAEQETDGSLSGAWKELAEDRLKNLGEM